MRKAFTLVEIMIVVAIIGIILAIAVPSFLRARETSRATSCQGNLKQIDSGKDQWAIENKKNSGDTCAMSDLVGSTLYVKSTPTCPSTTAAYTVGNVGTDPSCAIGSNANAAWAHVLTK